MKFIITVFTFLTFALSSNAQDFLHIALTVKSFDAVLQPRIDECKAHFDIEPYFEYSLGAIKHEPSMEEIKSLQNFLGTGRLAMPINKYLDHKAWDCKSYAEGLLIGGIATKTLSKYVQARYR